jgi:DNA polymerase-3 subunit alpha
MVKQFVDRKHGRAAVEYQHPALEPLLKDTYGTIVYQEQIMQIAQSLAGYSLGQADLLRRAMGKKKADVMEKERASFLAGCETHQVDLTLANNLFDTMSEFAAYCFNRSHSAAYAMVAYQTAFLKAHYPVEYLSALLSSVRNDLDKIQYYILTARKMGIQILPPDINTSGLEFTPQGDEGIRFGLASIKNVGVGVVENVLQARIQKPFESLEDFCERVDPRVLNRKTLESLINSGALSAFDQSRQQLFNNVDSLTSYAAKCQERQVTGQVSLFAAMGAANTAATISFSGLSLSGSPEEYEEETIQQLEKALLGFYVSSHPLDALRDTLPLITSHLIVDLKDCPDGFDDFVIGGLVSSLQKKVTKTNRPLWVGMLEDFSGEVEFVLFSDAIDKFGSQIAEGSKLLIQGKLQFRGDNGESYSIIANQINPVQDVSPVYLSVNQPLKWEKWVTLSQIFARHKGVCPVIICFPDGSQLKTHRRFWVSGDKGMLKSSIEPLFPNSIHIES